MCQGGQFYQALAEAWGLPCVAPRDKNKVKRLAFKYVLLAPPDLVIPIGKPSEAGGPPWPMCWKRSRRAITERPLGYARGSKPV